VFTARHKLHLYIYPILQVSLSLEVGFPLSHSLHNNIHLHVVRTEGRAVEAWQTSGTNAFSDIGEQSLERYCHLILSG